MLGKLLLSSRVLGAVPAVAATWFLWKSRENLAFLWNQVITLFISNKADGELWMWRRMHGGPFPYLKRRTWELALKIRENRSSRSSKRGKEKPRNEEKGRNTWTFSRMCYIGGCSFIKLQTLECISFEDICSGNMADYPSAFLMPHCQLGGQAKSLVTMCNPC